ncbi:hypothetical protein BGZ94_003703 [Podila epigama]|nr:hypothetical protein BGZ94_003703 [Podila epigama]
MTNLWKAAHSSGDKHGRSTGTYTTTKVGGNLCIRWPAKNHAVPSEKYLSIVHVAFKVKD